MLSWVTVVGIGLAARVADAGPCRVVYARASDEVRAAVDPWVEGEPACGAALELRIFEVPEGWYVLATSPTGAPRERVVAELQTAGALVASWLAEDATHATAPALGTAALDDDSPAILAPIAPPPPAPTADRWVTLTGFQRAGASDVTTNTGVRGDVDVIAKRGWSAGITLSAGLRDDVRDTTSAMDLRTPTRDYRLLAQFAYTVTRGRWQLRAGAGIGGMYSHFALHPVATELMYEDHNDASLLHTVLATGEVSAAITVRVGDHWGVTGGAFGTLNAHDVIAEDAFHHYQRSPTALFFTLGLRHTL